MTTATVADHQQLETLYRAEYPDGSARAHPRGQQRRGRRPRAGQFRRGLSTPARYSATAAHPRTAPLSRCRSALRRRRVIGTRTHRNHPAGLASGAGGALERAEPAAGHECIAVVLRVTGLSSVRDRQDRGHSRRRQLRRGLAALRKGAGPMKRFTDRVVSVLRRHRDRHQRPRGRTRRTDRGSRRSTRTMEEALDVDPPDKASRNRP